MCTHTPPCPKADAAHCCEAHMVSDHSEQGWRKLCNGVILFSDGLFLSPDGHVGEIPRLAA